MSTIGWYNLESRVMTTTALWDQLSSGIRRRLPRPETHESNPHQQNGKDVVNEEGFLRKKKGGSFIKLWGEDCSEDEESDADERNSFERDYSLGDFVLHRGELTKVLETNCRKKKRRFELKTWPLTALTHVADTVMCGLWAILQFVPLVFSIIGLLIIYMGLLNIQISSFSGCFLIIEKSLSLQTLTRNIYVVWCGEI